MTQAVSVVDMVGAAARGEQSAWDALVERYLPLVYSVIRQFRLGEKDAEDVNQTVWLRLVEQLANIREPLALPGWLVTTTKHEALRVLRYKQRSIQVDPGADWLLDMRLDSTEVDEVILRAERHAALREGLAELNPDQRRLLLLLVADPPLSYGEISRRLLIPVGSIGPTRARCLNKLRATASIQALLAAEHAGQDKERDRR